MAIAVPVRENRGILRCLLKILKLMSYMNFRIMIQALKKGLHDQQTRELRRIRTKRIAIIANEPAERRRSAGEAAENSAARRIAYVKKFSIGL